MSDKPEKKPKKRPRTVFGRVRLDVGGEHPVTVKMTKDYLTVRPYHSKRVYKWALRVAVLQVMANSKLE